MLAHQNARLVPSLTTVLGVLMDTGFNKVFATK